MTIPASGFDPSTTTPSPPAPPGPARSAGRLVAVLLLAGAAGAGLVQLPELLGGGRVEAREAAAVPAAGASPVASTAATAPARAPRVAGLVSHADAVEPALAAVVSVRATRAERVAGRGRGSSEPVPGWWFFGPQGPGEAPRPEREQESHGSGVIVRADGVILTNHHVIDGAQEVTVHLNDRRDLKATIVGTDPQTDIAVLKVEATGLPVLRPGASGRLRIGDLVFAIGNPLRIGQTVTMGIVSATRRDRLGIADYEDFIQTDAAINPGNSGGALINAAGELVGINTAIISHGVRANQGIGLAVPVHVALPVMEQVLAEGRVRRARLGVVIQEVTPSLARAMNLPGARGALVSQVQPGTPAEQAGLRPQDVVVLLDGESVVNDRQFRLDISSRRPGSRVRLGVLRGGRSLTLTATLEALDPDDVPALAGAVPGTPRAETAWGFSVEDLTVESRRRLELGADQVGVLVTAVEPGSPASRDGLQPGDVIMEAGQREATGVSDLRRAARDAGDGPLLLLVRRGPSNLFLVLEPR